MTTAVPPTAGELTSDQLRDAYRVMRTIREFEERLHREFATGDIPGFVHLYAGEEAIAAGVIAHLGPDDYVASTHRGHGHAIAKGCDVKGDDGRDLRQADRPVPRQGRLDAHRRHRRRACSAPTASSAAARRSSAGSALTAKVQADRPGRASRSPATAAPTRARSSRASTSPRRGTCRAVFVVENNGYAESTSAHLPPVGRRRGQARRRLRHARRHGRRVRLLRRPRGGGRGDRARPRAAGARR